MGILLKPTMGTPQGKAGGLVYRNVNGKVIFSSVPLIVKETESEEVLERRDRFKPLGALFTCMMEDFYIRTLWDRSDIRAGSTRNKMMKVNNSLFGKERDITKIVLAPWEKIFPASLQSIELREESMIFNLDPLDIYKLSEKYSYELSIHGLIHFSEPVPGISKPYRFVSFASETILYKRNITLICRIPFLSQEEFYFQEYQSRRFISAVIISNNLKEPKYCSNNIYGEL